MYQTDPVTVTDSLHACQTYMFGNLETYMFRNLDACMPNLHVSYMFRNLDLRKGRNYQQGLYLAS
jgi:hypothetical protein